MKGTLCAAVAASGKTLTSLGTPVGDFGIDTLRGDAGNDTLNGNEGAVSLVGNSDADTIYGTDGFGGDNDKDIVWTSGGGVGTGDVAMNALHQVTEDPFRFLSLRW